MSKTELRQQMLNQRKKLLASDIQQKSSQINQHIKSLAAFNKATTILFFLPIKNEPNTLPLLKSVLKQKKRVLIPVVKKQTLILSQLNSLEEVWPQKYNILEPKTAFLRPTSPELVDLSLLPGLAFDLQGYRLGYGGGYFDRLLPQLRPQTLKIGLAYDFQVITKLPREKHDQPVNLIITETNIYYA